jgi:uncharacterized membrane protein YgdD (TMEM256/DUF423 family)
MMTYERLAGCLAAVLGALGVAAGAYAAHGLGADARAAALMATCSQFALFHALAAMLALTRGGLGRWAAALFLLGVLLFSGSLAQLALVGAGGFADLAPIGGLALIAGWLTLAVAWLRASAQGG